MTSPTLRRIAGLAAPAVLAVGLAACGTADASRADVQDELEESGMTSDQASCVTDSLFDDLDQGQVNELYEAGPDDEVGDEITDATTTALEECADPG